MNRNDSPRSINKLHDLVRDIFFSKVLFDKFSPEFIEALQNEEDNHVVIIYSEY
jgi:hypothetical protein